MNKQITVTVNGKPRLANVGMALSEIINSEKPCGGHGKCGKCKVIVKGKLSAPSDDELKLLTTEELAIGVRLACLTYVLGDCEIVVPQNQTSQILIDGVLPALELDPAFSKYGVAIDIGTTTLAARLYDMNGNMLSDASLVNPQQQWGADVISRIEAALNGQSLALSKSIRQAVDNLIFEAANRAAVNTKDIDGVVITGNTVMLSLLTKQSVEPFSHAPFNAERLFDETLTASELELLRLMPNTPVYLPPCVSAFIGGDTTCALLATGLCAQDTAVMADIGTNGEMALWNNGKLTVCSTAAGPAFEGVGISMGMRCAEGAIDKISIENGQLKVHTIGDAVPVGICGSGLLDAVACMLELGAVDESGYLEDDKYMIQQPVQLTPKDVRMLQLAKSAICAGLLTLIYNGDHAPLDISSFYISGGFGNYLNIDNAVRLGLLPKPLATVACTVGNAALSGAAMILLNSELKAAAQRVARNAEVLELSSNCAFLEYYMMGMSFEEQ